LSELDGSASAPGHRKKKTVLRTIRLPEEILLELDAAAADDGISFNSLMVNLLTDYTVWQRKSRKFGFATISKQFLRMLLDSSDPVKLEKVVREKYPSVMKSMAMFWYNDSSPTSMIKVLSLISVRNWYVELNQTVEGKAHTMTFHHDLGPVFSLFLKTMIDSTVRNEFHSHPVFQEGESSLTVQFTLP
jgi:hypothetical protein